MSVAYAIMLDRDLPDDIPGSYSQKHGVSSLSEHDSPPDAGAIQQDARTFAENSIQALHRDIFPTHGLRGGVGVSVGVDCSGDGRTRFTLFEPISHGIDHDGHVDG